MCLQLQPFVTLTDSQGDVNGIGTEDTADSADELTTTRLAHYRETLCVVKPLQTSSSTAAVVLTRQQHIELLSVSY